MRLGQGCFRNNGAQWLCLSAGGRTPVIENISDCGRVPATASGLSALG